MSGGRSDFNMTFFYQGGFDMICSVRDKIELQTKTTVN